MTDEEIVACLAAMRNGHTYLGEEYIEEHEGERRIVKYIEELEAELATLRAGANG